MANWPNSMKVARWICLLVIGLMAINFVRAASLSGMDHGAGGDTFGAGYADPWQGLINSDLVCGLFLSMGWVAYRERASKPWPTALWLWIIFYWGNIVVATYILYAMTSARGSWEILLRGDSNRPARAIPLPRLAKAALYAAALACLCYIVWAIATVDRATGVVWWGYLGGFAPFIPAAITIANRDRL